LPTLYHMAVGGGKRRSRGDLTKLALSAWGQGQGGGQVGLVPLGGVIILAGRNRRSPFDHPYREGAGGKGAGRERSLTMRYANRTATLGALACLAVLGAPSLAWADPIVVGDGWHMFNWQNGPGVFNTESPFTFNASGAVELKVTDAYVPGDR